MSIRIIRATLPVELDELKAPRESPGSSAETEQPESDGAERDDRTGHETEGDYLLLPRRGRAPVSEERRGRGRAECRGEHEPQPIHVSRVHERPEEASSETG